jgi:hypothetical protein
VHAEDHHRGVDAEVLAAGGERGEEESAIDL